MGSIYAEEIIKARQGAKQKEQQNPDSRIYQVENDIEKGYVVVRYEQLKLKERQIMDGKAVMLLPENLEEMSEELVRIKYPDPDRPKWILSDQEGEVTMTFHLEEGETEEGELEEIIGLLKNEMKRMYPLSPIEEEEPVGEGRERVCWFSLDIPLIDDVCCHVMFFREMEEGVLMGTFDCIRDGKKQWKPILRQVLATIREDNGKDEYENSVQ